MIFSCIKDKGDYEYIELNEFRLDTTGLAFGYSVQRGRELLVIDQPLIAQDTTDYTYIWRR